MSTVIIASSAIDVVDSTAGVCPTEVVNVAGIVTTVENIEAPATLISTEVVPVLAPVPSDIRGILVSVIACGARKVSFAVPVVSAVDSSETAIVMLLSSGEAIEDPENSTQNES